MQQRQLILNADCTCLFSRAQELPAPLFATYRVNVADGTGVTFLHFSKCVHAVTCTLGPGCWMRGALTQKLTSFSFCMPLLSFFLIRLHMHLLLCDDRAAILIACIARLPLLHINPQLVTQESTMPARQLARWTSSRACRMFNALRGLGFAVNLIYLCGWIIALGGLAAGQKWCKDHIDLFDQLDEPLNYTLLARTPGDECRKLYRCGQRSAQTELTCLLSMM